MGSTGTHSLPEELMMMIMWRLPVNSLLRFKSVCKNWHSVIQNPDFINQHYNHPNNHTRLLVHSIQHTCILDTPSPRRTEYRYISQLILFSDETLSNTITEDIVNPLTPFDGGFIRIIGPVNGLFFMYYGSHDTSYDDCQLALWNPATTEFRVLPPPIRSPQEGFAFSFGFGLDLLTGDFKVVRIPCVGRDGSLVQLYSLANDSWRGIDSVFASSSLAHIRLDLWHNTYLDGAYYWLSSTRPCPTIILFDMGREVFREIQTPISNEKQSLTDYPIEGIRLLLFNDSIAMLQTHYSDNITVSIDVWVMKEDECWTKNSIVGLAPPLFFLPHRFWMNGELLLHKYDPDHYNSKLVLYNPKSGRLQNLGTWHNFISNIFSNYKASLTSVKGGRRLCQTSYTSTSNNNKRKRTALI